MRTVCLSSNSSPTYVIYMTSPSRWRLLPGLILHFPNILFIWLWWVNPQIRVLRGRFAIHISPFYWSTLFRVCSGVKWLERNHSTFILHISVVLVTILCFIFIPYLPLAVLSIGACVEVKSSVMDEIERMRSYFWLTVKARSRNWNKENFRQVIEKCSPLRASHQNVLVKAAPTWHLLHKCYLP